MINQYGNPAEKSKKIALFQEKMNVVWRKVGVARQFG